MEYILETNGLTKKYGHFTALYNLDMHIPKGSIYGLIGKNGAGKTTLIRILCGLQKPSAGSYSIYGITNSDRKLTNIRKRVGAIIEAPALCLDMTAEDNLKEQYKIVGLPSYDGLQEILQFFRLTPSDTGSSSEKLVFEDAVFGDGGKKQLLHSKPKPHTTNKKSCFFPPSPKTAKHFSLGMKQRLGLAIALVGNPDMLILDEPINGLDPEGIIEIRELILKLNKEKGITFLISSHYLDELSKIATCYGFLNNNRIVKEITSDELEHNFKKRIQITVSNIKECVNYLEEIGISYKVISNEVVDLYAKINVSEFVIALSNRNCLITDLQEKGESLENYYLNLIGGADNG